MELETARTLAERRAVLREKHATEMALHAVNEKKIHAKWLQVMREAKTEELKRSITVHQAAHQRRLDRKNAQIEALAADLDEAEAQHRTAAKQHAFQMDQFISLHRRRVRDVEDEFRRETRLLEEEFAEEQRRILAGHEAQKKNAHELRRAMEDAHEASLSELRANLETAREEIKNRNGEEYDVLKFSLESAIEALERHFEEAHGAYLGSTDNRTESFKRLTKSDATSAKTIEKRMRRLLRLKEQIETQKRRETASRAEWAERNRGVRAEKERVRAHYEKLDKEMRRDREREKRRLLKLVEESGEARKALEAKTATAEKALRLARMARALETEAEKIAPFASGVHPVAGGSDATHADSDQSAATEEERAIASAMARVEAAEGRRALLEGAAAEAAAEAAAATSRGGAATEMEPASEPGGIFAHGPGSLSSWGSDEAGAVVPEHAYLDRFFGRFNSAYLDERAAEREKRRLERENADLRALLKRHLDGTDVNAEVIADPNNPLFVVNDRVLKTQEARRRAAESARRGTRGRRRRERAGGGRWCSCEPTDVIIRCFLTLQNIDEPSGRKRQQRHLREASRLVTPRGAPSPLRPA